MLGAALAVLATSLVTGNAVAGSRARVVRTPTVPTVRCRTEFGASPPPTRIPSRVAVRGGPRSVDGIVAYTNRVLFLIAPAGMACSGLDAADGGSVLLLWRHGEHKPTQHSHQAGLSLTLDPACSSCRAEEACPFFPALARQLDFPCIATVPTREVVDHISRRLILFQDPPGVPGDGWPSGGPDPANGLVGITPRYDEVYRATCTLPASRHQACTTSLNDVISRYG